MFCSVKGYVSVYMGNQALYFEQMTLNKLTRAQEGVPTSQSGSPTIKWPELAIKRPAKITPKIAHSTLLGDPTANFFGPKSGLLHHKVAS